MMKEKRLQGIGNTQSKEKKGREGNNKKNMSVMRINSINNGKDNEQH